MKFYLHKKVALALLDLLTFLLGNIATLLGDYVMATLVISNRLTHCLENAATFCKAFLAAIVLINKLKAYF